MATKVVDVCKNSRCTGTKYKCNLCVERMLALALKPLHEAYENKVSSLQGYENKVRFLQAYEPGPLSESFRGDVSFIGTDLEPVHVFDSRSLDQPQSVIDVVRTGDCGFMKAGKSSIFRKMFDIDMKEKESEKCKSTMQLLLC
ncbi:hypothetical protein AXG93_4604s1010 [Marchantia polymorpha subsp. ruderalis]|uniref:Uncharacterized protein n=1 Tax=Marchantia polymorpha subsp. ruderalis TaxID=1480154 RepID=A0A176VZH6_MARPO|nr:hypothetical protein AXG93_4604s1010 [Marchantia polymorpha subsp. ruderalis]